VPLSLDPKAARKAVMTAKTVARSIDPGYAKPSLTAMDPPMAFKDGGAAQDNFMRWFDKSVLHDKGVPRRYYTGTSKDKDFSSFNVGRHGVWFTSDPKVASQYAVENDSQNFRLIPGSWKYEPVNSASRVIPAYLRAENPYTGDMPDRVHAENYKKAQSDWFDELRAKGHDSWVPASQEGRTAVILKHPNQIKSAIGNSGEYSDKPAMTKATGGSVNSEPTEAQKAAGNYRKAHISIHGLDISVENHKGSTRSGRDGGGKRWSVVMPADYGYLKRTEGADGDHVDCYVGPDRSSTHAFIVNQRDARTKKFDEHKVMLGYRSEAEALRDYVRAFSDGKGSQRMGGMQSLSIDAFKKWLKAGDTKKPASHDDIVERALRSSKTTCLE
jgi:hypothetical protein